MQGHEETFFADRIAAIAVPLNMARHNREWDAARSALRAIRSASIEDVMQESNVLLRRRLRLLLVSYPANNFTRNDSVCHPGRTEQRERRSSNGPSGGSRGAREARRGVMVSHRCQERE
jgi:hypothetical protein